MLKLIFLSAGFQWALERWHPTGGFSLPRKASRCSWRVSKYQDQARLPLSFYDGDGIIENTVGQTLLAFFHHVGSRTCDQCILELGIGKQVSFLGFDFLMIQSDQNFQD